MRRSVTATGSSQDGQWPPVPIRRQGAVAVVAPLLAEIALVALTALVDRVLETATAWRRDGRRDLIGHLMATAPGGLPASG